MEGRSLYFVRPHETELRPTAVDPTPAEVVVETRVSAINAGTERLIYTGNAPTDLPADETIDALDGDLSFPLRYGYAAVGDVVETGGAVADDWHGETVFAFNPHETHFSAAPESLIPVPDDLPPAHAAILPSAETATSLVLDGEPTVGGRVVVFGAGVIGLCAIAILAGFPLDQLVAVDPVASRREHARRLGADAAVAPADAPDAVAGDDGADLVYELSGQPEALDDALAVTGYDSHVVVGSWYGTKRAPIDLGGEFHRDRVTIESSQVSTLAPDSRGRWDKDRRLETALDRLRAIDVESLVTHRVPFDDAPAAYQLLEDADADPLQILLTYD